MIKKGFPLLIFCLASASLPASAENPVPTATPFGAQIDHYERFLESRNEAASEQPFDDYNYNYKTTAQKPKLLAVLVPGTPTATTPAAPPNQSALESMYSRRAGQNLSQFGYDLFGLPNIETQDKLDTLARDETLMPMGAVQDDFLLHAGDELDIAFTGQRTDRGLYKVNSQGQILIPDLPPIPAEGRAIGQVRLSIQAAAQSLHNTEAYVSLSSVRQIGVLVVGHVKRPGRQTLTVFHTVIDALTGAGGIDKTGSLRQVKLVRGGKAMPIDLYALLIKGAPDSDLRLRDGDRLIIPPIGPTLAVTGEIKRPGIYEILPGAQKLTLNEMLDLSGGVLAPGRNRFLNLEVTRGGHERISEIHDVTLPLFGDGGALMVQKGEEKRAGTIEISGHARRPGLYAIDETPTLANLLSTADILGPDAYPLIGVIERRDPDTLGKKLIAFPLRRVLRNEHDEKLEDGDKIHLFSDTDIRREGGQPGDIIAAFLKEQSVTVRGSVRGPGLYPVAEGVTLKEILAVAGGLSVEADPSRIELSALSEDTGKPAPAPKRRMLSLTESETVTVHAGDAVRVNQKFKRDSKTVLIIGEVTNPGRYDLLAGDTVSDLLQRAGGLTGDAYPDGAIFSRESERRAEEARFRAQAREMQAAIAAALEQDSEKIGAGQIAEARALAMQLQEAEGVGRITVETDPATLQQNPELDMLLESGDRLYIPKRSLTVRVTGEVLSPVSLQFRKNKEAEDYIDESGGLTMNADKDRAFVVYPDGSAQPLDISWGGDDLFIPPGSTIVVPRDPEPFDFIQSAKDVSQILSNLAITALFINDVRDSD